MMRAFELFYNSSILKANIQKSLMFSSDMNNIHVKRVVKASRFVKSSLPFKYLGVSNLL